MKVQDVMNPHPVACTRETDLAAAAMMMWNGDCGVVPVLAADKRVISVITDRDICMAVATKHRKAEDITVGEVISGKLYACAPEDDIHKAVEMMRINKVRRLPVVDKDRRLRGIFSMNDVALEARAKKNGAPTYEEVVNAFKSICEHRISAVAA